MAADLWRDLWTTPRDGGGQAAGYMWKMLVVFVALRLALLAEGGEVIFIRRCIFHS
jgi:hypothetical protein